MSNLPPISAFFDCYCQAYGCLIHPPELPAGQVREGGSVGRADRTVRVESWSCVTIFAYMSSARCQNGSTRKVVRAQVRDEKQHSKFSSCHRADVPSLLGRDSIFNNKPVKQP